MAFELGWLFVKGCVELVALFGSAWLGVTVGLHPDKPFTVAQWITVILLIISVFLGVWIQFYYLAP